MTHMRDARYCPPLGTGVPGSGGPRWYSAWVRLVSGSSGMSGQRACRLWMTSALMTRRTCWTRLLHRTARKFGGVRGHPLAGPHGGSNTPRG